MRLRANLQCALRGIVTVGRLPTVVAGLVGAAVLYVACGTDSSPTEVPTRASLTVTLQGRGRVTSDPAGIDLTHAGGTATATFARGTSVTLTGQPDHRWELGSWSGACNSESTTCVVSMQGDRAVVVDFTELPPVDTIVSLDLIADTIEVGATRIYPAHVETSDGVVLSSAAVSWRRLRRAARSSHSGPLT